MFRKIVILIVVFSLCISFCLKGTDYRTKLKDAYHQSPYIAHALGGIEGFCYLNVIEAIDYHYNHGCRVFEVDLEYTMDKKLVLAHGCWRKIDYQRLGIAYNSESPVPTYDEFMSWEVQGKYKTADFTDLVNAMKKYKDIFVVLDLGNVSYEETLHTYQDIVALTNHDKSVLKRFIAGGQSVDMVKASRAAYDFDLMLLYLHAEKDRRGMGYESVEQFVSVCKENKVNIVSTADATYTSEVAEALAKQDLIRMVFTINDEQRCNQVIQTGAAVGTDFLCGNEK